jgi:hypothetical protein
MRFPAVILTALAVFVIQPGLYAQSFHDTCDTHSWVAINQELTGKDSALCEGVANLAAGKPASGREILLQVIREAPRSDAAYEAHEALLSFYARAGQFRSAAPRSEHY